MMESSKFSCKLFIDGDPKLDDFVPVFHSWIQTHIMPDHLLIDVASYTHVHNGPGVVLVAREANFSLDRRGGMPGLTYQRKHPIDGSLADRLAAVFRWTQTAAALLKDRVKFRTDLFELRICDRLHAPNSSETFQLVRPELLKLWPGANLEHLNKPEELFTVLIRPTRPITIG